MSGLTLALNIWTLSMTGVDSEQDHSDPKSSSPLQQVLYSGPGSQKVFHLKCRYKRCFYRFNSMTMATGSGLQSWAPLLGSRRVILGDRIVSLSSRTLELISWINITEKKNVTAEVKFDGHGLSIFDLLSEFIWDKGFNKVKNPML